MEALNLAETEQVGGGDVSGLGPFTPPSLPTYEDPNLAMFIEWKLMNPGYPYDQP